MPLKVLASGRATPYSQLKLFDFLYKVFKVEPTSYDYDAPISEAGDLKEKYFAFKTVIAKHLSLPDQHRYVIDAISQKGN